ncbi:MULTISPECIES: DUF3558 domain-containing protein [Gordonia]|uniref:DUF3558 domain-containing protein n=1 Tax=Gordonia TaxID=2053 RepID=UPI003393B4D0
MRTSAASLAAVIVVSLTVGGCATSGSPIPTVHQSSSSTAGPSIRQTDDVGRKLPFENKFPNRWSINNDGTTYEPCTALSKKILVRFGLNPESVQDAAGSDFQTVRGCEWEFIDDELSAVSQYVGNMQRPNEGLNGYRESNSAAATWLPDIEIDGRPVLVNSFGQGECAVLVESGRAIVSTSVSLVDSTPPPTAQVCGDAEAVLRATIDQIPK